MKVNELIEILNKVNQDEIIYATNYGDEMYEYEIDTVEVRRCFGKLDGIILNI